MRPEHYFKGDRCEYTGKSEILHGALCYEFEFMEGHRLAQFGWTYHKPAAKPTGNGTVGLPVSLTQEGKAMKLEPIEYLYRPMLRPASFCTVPEGWDYVEAPANEPEIAMRRGMPLSKSRYGIIAYQRRLTKEERLHYGLEIV